MGFCVLDQTVVGPWLGYSTIKKIQETQPHTITRGKMRNLESETSE